MSDEGRKKLANLHKQIRDKVTPAGAPLLDKKGLEIVEQLSKDLAGPEAAPGIRLYRDAPNKFRLQRPPRNAEITIEWQREIGALVVTADKHGQPKAMSRFVWDEGQGHWRSMDDNGELYDAVSALLVECLFPEAK